MFKHQKSRQGGGGKTSFMYKHIQRDKNGNEEKGKINEERNIFILMMLFLFLFYLKTFTSHRSQEENVPLRWK